MLRVDSRSNNTLYEDFQKLWDLDSIGIREKDMVHEAFEKNVSFQDGKYSVHLPWKEHHKLLPDNYENSVARLSSQLKRLRRDPEVKENTIQLSRISCEVELSSESTPPNAQMLVRCITYLTMELCEEMP